MGGILSRSSILAIHLVLRSVGLLESGDLASPMSRYNYLTILVGR